MKKNQKDLLMYGAIAAGVYLIAKKKQGSVSGIGAVKESELNDVLEYLIRATGKNLKFGHAYGKMILRDDRGHEFGGYQTKKEMLLYLRGIEKGIDFVKY